MTYNLKYFNLSLIKLLNYYGNVYKQAFSVSNYSFYETTVNDEDKEILNNVGIYDEKKLYVPISNRTVIPSESDINFYKYYNIVKPIRIPVFNTKKVAYRKNQDGVYPRYDNENTKKIIYEYNPQKIRVIYENLNILSTSNISRRETIPTLIKSYYLLKLIMLDILFRTEPSVFLSNILYEIIFFYTSFPQIIRDINAIIRWSYSTNVELSIKPSEEMISLFSFSPDFIQSMYKYLAISPHIDFKLFEGENLITLPKNPDYPKYEYVPVVLEGDFVYYPAPRHYNITTILPNIRIIENLDDTEVLDDESPLFESI